MKSIELFGKYVIPKFKNPALWCAPLPRFWTTFAPPGRPTTPRSKRSKVHRMKQPETVSR